MRRFALKALLGASMALPLAAAGCAHEHHHHFYGDVVVEEAPPPPPREVIEVSPGPEFIYIGGYYRHGGGRWVWERGHYERRSGHREWVEHRWVRSEHGYRFEEGHWR